jgi:hypothetical protein
VSLREAEIAAATPLDPTLFLGRMDAAALRRELEEAGVFARLAELGYADVVLRTGIESGEHRIQILPRRGRIRLVDVRLAEATSVADEPLMQQHALHVLSFLAIQWVSFQHPRGRFTAERPRLPGQRHPGLGLGKDLTERLRGWARAWGKDGLINFPEYYHNAVLYSSLFRFLSPTRQGRFLALCRDLATLRVAAASSAVDAGRVVEEPAGRVFEWESGEMVAPVGRGLAEYLDSSEYRRAAEAVRDAVRFRLA